MKDNKWIKEMELKTYTDNYRYAKIGNELQEKYYEIIKNTGCCGFADREITHKKHGSFRIGLNYGH